LRLLTENTVSIACDVRSAFAYVSNMENFAQWFPNVRLVASADAQAHATLGKQYVEVVATPRGEQKIPLRVKAVEPDRLFVTEGEYPPLMPRMEIEFQSQGAGCTVTWRMFSRNTSLLARFTWLRLARRVIRERATLGLAQLKKQLERT
jgi:uncharacterized protein YndB with AHSA1/START domain